MLALFPPWPARWGVVCALLAGLVPLSPAHANFFDRAEVRAGVLLIEVVGSVAPEEDIDGLKDDGVSILETQDVQDSCFASYKDPTSTIDFVRGKTIWGSANDGAAPEDDDFEDVSRVVLRLREASDFGFNPDATVESNDPNVDGLDCSSFETQWDTYSPRESGLLVFQQSLTGATGGLRIEAGETGTEVEIDEGIDFLFSNNTSLQLAGQPGDPVIVGGDQWTGFDIPAGVSATLAHCEVTGASDSALRVNGGSLEASNCEFRNNEGGKGGAVRVVDGGNATIRDSRFEGNEAQLGGGLYAEDPASGLTVDDTVFDGNEAFARGGGLHLESASNVRLQNVTIVGHESGRGGGISIEGGANGTRVALWNPLIVGNTSRRDGGGLHVEGGESAAYVTLYNPTIAFNEAENGGGIFVADARVQSLDVRNGIVTGNNLLLASGQGSQVANLGGSPGVRLQRVLIDESGDNAIVGLVAEQDLTDARPGFRSPPDGAGEGNGSSRANFRLTGLSPGVNAGDGSLFDASGFRSVDRLGGDRIFGQEDPAIDLGAFEFPNNPPTLLDTSGGNPETDEDAAPIELRLCGRYSDSDLQPRFPNATRRPWLTRAPDDVMETIGEDASAEEDMQQGPDFGDVLAYDGGAPGDRVMSNNAIGDPQGRAFYDPANRSESYTTVIQCRVRDVLIDAEGEINDTLSLFSRRSEQITVDVVANNDVPNIQDRLDRKASVGQAYESEVMLDDPDTDQPARSLQARVLEGPEWLSLQRTAADTLTFTGTPTSPGTVTVRYEVIDPPGGTAAQSVDIEVSEPEGGEPLVAGDDRTAEPGDRVRLQAEGRTGQPDLTLRWEILDASDSQVTSQEGRIFNWEAQEGTFTARVRAIANGETIDQDSLEVSVDAGLNGSATEQQQRSEPSDEEQAQIDGMSDSGSQENRQAWNNNSTSEKAQALSEIAQRELSDKQRQTVLKEASEVLGEATAGGSDVSQETAERLAEAYAGLSGADLSGNGQARVADGIAAVRDAAEKTGNVSASTRASLVDATGGLLSEQDLSDALRSEVASPIASDLSALQEQLADSATPVDAALATRAANAAARVAAAEELSSDQRNAVRDTIDAVRDRANTDGIASSGLTAALVRGESALLTRADELSTSARNTRLEQLAGDLSQAVGDGQELPVIAANRSLAALQNAAEAGQLKDGQLEQVLSSIESTLRLATPLTSQHGTKASVILDRTVSTVGIANLSDAQVERVRQVARMIAARAAEAGADFNATGSQAVKIAATRLEGTIEGELVVGKTGSQGPRLVLSAASRAELRRRNGLAEDAPLSLAIIATRLTPDSGYIVEIVARNPNSGRDLTGVSLERSVRLTIPVTDEGKKTPIRVDATPTNASNVAKRARGVSFDTGELGRFTLAGEVDESDGRGGSDKSGCFLGSLF